MSQYETFCGQETRQRESFAAILAIVAVPDHVLRSREVVIIVNQKDFLKLCHSKPPHGFSAHGLEPPL
ncbi:MAG: hypothetical protein AAFR45_01480, partial [Pseudomonadota bacterium]